MKSLCSNAQNQTDYHLFEYLIEKKKVDKDVVDAEGNGLVYTAFVAANIPALKVLAQVNAAVVVYSQSIVWRQPQSV